MDSGNARGGFHYDVLAPRNASFPPYRAPTRWLGYVPISANRAFPGVRQCRTDCNFPIIALPCANSGTRFDGAVTETLTPTNTTGLAKQSSAWIEPMLRLAPNALWEITPDMSKSPSPQERSVFAKSPAARTSTRLDRPRSAAYDRASAPGRKRTPRSAADGAAPRVWSGADGRPAAILRNRPELLVSWRRCPRAG